MGSGGLARRGGLLLLSLSVELEGNATVSNRKRGDLANGGRLQLNACFTKQPVGISSALRKVSAMWGTGTIISFSDE